jgi:hypothetical protein
VAEREHLLELVDHQQRVLGSPLSIAVIRREDSLMAARGPVTRGENADGGKVGAPALAQGGYQSGSQK